MCISSTSEANPTSEAPPPTPPRGGEHGFRDEPAFSAPYSDPLENDELPARPAGPRATFRKGRNARHPDQVAKSLREKAAAVPIPVRATAWTLMLWNDKTGLRVDVQFQGSYAEAVRERSERMAGGAYFKGWLILRP